MSVAEAMKAVVGVTVTMLTVPGERSGGMTLTYAAAWRTSPCGGPLDRPRGWFTFSELVCGPPIHGLPPQPFSCGWTWPTWPDLRDVNGAL